MRHAQEPKPNSNLGKTREAWRLTRLIISRYPYQDKATPDYLVSVANHLAGYAPEIQTEIADLRTGIVSKCAFLPTVADISKFVEDIEKSRKQFETPPPVYPYFSPSHSRPHKPLMPEDREVYADSGTPERVSMPHEAKGKPWGVKPEGYWTRWTPEERKVWDDEDCRNNGVAAQ